MGLGCFTAETLDSGDGFEMAAEGFGGSGLAAVTVTGGFGLACCSGWGDTLLTVGGWEGLLGTVAALVEDEDAETTPTCF